MTSTHPSPPRQARFARKAPSLDEALFYGRPDPISIQAAHEMRAEEYDRFVESLLQTRDWLADFGGTLADGTRLVIELRAPQRETLYLDPQGYGYVRYVGIAA